MGITDKEAIDKINPASEVSDASMLISAGILSYKTKTAKRKKVAVTR